MIESIFLIVALLVLNLIPAFLWLTFYMKEDRADEPKLLLLLAFVVGGLSTVPLFFLKYVLQWLAPWLPTMSEITWSWLPIGIIISLFLAAFIEEMSKHMCALYVMDRDYQAHNELLDGITYGVVVALGFSFIENSYYLWEYMLSRGISWDLLYLYLVRSTIPMLAHTVFSGFFGYFYALGYIKPNTKVITHSAYYIGLPSILTHFSWRHLFFMTSWNWYRATRGKSHTSNHNAIEMVIEGMWLAVILHTLYNVILNFSGNLYLPLSVLFLGFTAGTLITVVIAHVKTVDA